MPKKKKTLSEYQVIVPFYGWTEVEVEASSPEEARDIVKDHLPDGVDNFSVYEFYNDKIKVKLASEGYLENSGTLSIEMAQE